MIWRIGIALLSLLRWTWRIRPCGSVPQHGVLAFWHGEMLPVWAFLARHDAVALVSQSRDGALLAKLLEQWGYRCIRGSSSRGGKEALNELVMLARQGTLVLITPDGPRGPRGVVKRGAVLCAQKAQVPLYWCRVHCRWVWRFRRSWDQFILPLPFARIELEFSAPIVVSASLDTEGVSTLCGQLQRHFAVGD